MEIQDELRSSVRFPLELPVSVKTGPVEHAAHTKDISAGGVLFYVDSHMSVGSTIEFRIALPAGVLGTPTDVVLNCTGRVVRSVEENGRRAVAAVIDEYDFERE